MQKKKRKGESENAREQQIGWTPNFKVTVLFVCFSLLSKLLELLYLFTLIPSHRNSVGYLCLLIEVGMNRLRSQKRWDGMGKKNREIIITVGHSHVGCGDEKVRHR